MADAAARGETPKFKLFRGRTFLYAGMIIIVAAIMVYALASRAIIDVSVQHERSPLFTTMSDGGVRNAYTVKITNKRHENRQFDLSVVGLEGADVSRVGGESGLPVFTVGPDTIDAFHVFVTVPRDRVVPSRDLQFIITDKGSGDVASTESSFKGPSK